MREEIVNLVVLFTNFGLNQESPLEGSLNTDKTQDSELNSDQIKRNGSRPNDVPSLNFDTRVSNKTKNGYKIWLFNMGVSGLLLSSPTIFQWSFMELQLFFHTSETGCVCLGTTEIFLNVTVFSITAPPACWITLPKHPLVLFIYLFCNCHVTIVFCIDNNLKLAFATLKCQLRVTKVSSKESCVSLILIDVAKQFSNFKIFFLNIAWCSVSTDF